MNETDVRNNGKAPWRVRRAIIFLTLMFCAGCIIWILAGQPDTDTRVNESIVLGCFGLAASVIGAYIFGATWDDNTRRVQYAGGPDSSVNIITASPANGARGARAENSGAVSDDRKKAAAERLARIKARKMGVDNPDA